MSLIELTKSAASLEGKSQMEITKLSRLLSELKKRELPESVVTFVNVKVEEINSTSLTGKPLEKFLATKVTEILKLLEKELKLVPQHHYRTIWMLMGMSSFGLPLGVVIGMSIGNIALLGVGLPIGMGIGIALGVSLDEKAKKEGRQLNLSEEQ